MYSKVKTYISEGMQAETMWIEATILNGFPSFHMSGMNSRSSSMMESRLRASFHHAGYKWPHGRIILALTPAWSDSAPQDNSLDLPAALALLAADGQIKQNPESEDGKAYLGALSLDSSLQPLSDLLPCLKKAEEDPDCTLVLPRVNKTEMHAFEGIRTCFCSNLEEGVDAFRGLRPDQINQAGEHTEGRKSDWSHWRYYKGQESALMAVEIACAGWHPLLLLGSPGSGKSSLCHLASELLPDLSPIEQLETERIWKLAGKRISAELQEAKRPFVQTHHTVSVGNLTGGGRPPRPGAFSLSHHGILFTDEIMEMKAETLDCFREPLDNAAIGLSRTSHIDIYPADFLWLAAGNPCRCGMAFEEAGTRCRCSPQTRRLYERRFHHPAMERFHLCVCMKSFSHANDRESPPAESYFEEMKERVQMAWKLQMKRYMKLEGRPLLNGRCPPNLRAEDLDCPDPVSKLATELCLGHQQSLRRMRQLLLVSRTAADLRCAQEIKEEDVYLAHSYIMREYL